MLDINVNLGTEYKLTRCGTLGQLFRCKILTSIPCFSISLAVKTVKFSSQERRCGRGCLTGVYCANF